MISRERLDIFPAHGRLEQLNMFTLNKRAKKVLITLAGSSSGRSKSKNRKVKGNTPVEPKTDGTVD